MDAPRSTEAPRRMRGIARCRRGPRAAIAAIAGTMRSMAGGTGHRPVWAGYQPAASGAPGMHLLVGGSLCRSSAASCRRERPGRPFHPDPTASFRLSFPSGTSAARCARGRAAIRAVHIRRHRPTGCRCPATSLSLRPAACSFSALEPIRISVAADVSRWPSSRTSPRPRTHVRSYRTAGGYSDRPLGIRCCSPHGHASSPCPDPATFPLAYESIIRVSDNSHAVGLILTSP